MQTRAARACHFVFALDWWAGGLQQLASSGYGSDRRGRSAAGTGSQRYQPMPE